MAMISVVSEASWPTNIYQSNAQTTTNTTTEPTKEAIFEGLFITALLDFEVVIVVVDVAEAD